MDGFSIFQSEISCLKEMTELGWGKELEFWDLPALPPHPNFNQSNSNFICLYMHLF